MSDRNNNNTNGCKTSMASISFIIFKLRSVTNKIIWLVIHGDRQNKSRHWSMEPLKIYGRKQFQTNMSNISYERNRESMFANIQLSFGKKKLFGNG